MSNGNRRKSEGFRLGSVVVALRDVQGLKIGTKYVVVRRGLDRQQGVRYALLPLEDAVAASFEVTNLPLLAELAEEEKP